MPIQQSCWKVELDDGSDLELRQLACQEAESRHKERKSLENQILSLLLPPDRYADCAAVNMELIAGAGGLEAAMFARDLFTMYATYARQRGWNFSPQCAPTEAASESPINHVSVLIESMDPDDPVYARLHWEAGVHRVQRVPTTSKLNKIHTSTVAVTVLPVVDEDDVALEPDDLEWSVFRSSGPGGQHVNKTESAVRVRHKPTGHVVACQNDRSQHANREAALKILKAKIAKDVVQRQIDSELAERRSQMGSLARSDRIRTYNYPQDRVTDHRLGRSWNGLASFLYQTSSELDAVADAMDEAYKLSLLATLDKPYFLL
uniref:RF_PROK_I domain-containing protein n=1 Tax=Mesocestoides corti TaxID=53468 RepID=A0A5K3FB30_MESCO